MPELIKLSSYSKVANFKSYSRLIGKYFGEFKLNLYIIQSCPHWLTRQKLLRLLYRISLNKTNHEWSNRLQTQCRRFRHWIKLYGFSRNQATFWRVSIWKDPFFQGWQYFKDHQDKSYSFTDCISFILMEQRHISQALTFDKHFIQARFSKLPQ